MFIQVGLLSGEVQQYTLPEGAQASELISQISATYGVDVQLVQCGQQVSLNTLLDTEYTYYVTVDAEGGKKKKKKKTQFSTKKKTKHRHRKIKLATLKLYSVDKNGNVQKNNKQCPQCLQGVYMGKHFDRHYCGTCHYTLKMDEAAVQKIKANLEALKRAQKAKEANAPKADDKADAGKKKDAKKGKKK